MIKNISNRNGRALEYKIIDYLQSESGLNVTLTERAENSQARDLNNFNALSEGLKQSYVRCAELVSSWLIEKLDGNNVEVDRLSDQDAVAGDVTDITAFAKYLAWSQNDVPDIFQTALLNAYKKFDSYAEDTNFKSWIFKFVTYAAFNLNRRHEKINSREILVEAESIIHEQSLGIFEEGNNYDQFLKDPEVVLDSIGDEISNAVRSLPGRRRCIFLLKAVGELSYKEISGILDIPIGTVMGELFRARKQLRHKLRRYSQEFGIVKKGSKEDVV
jgi:RNA polymerase sigma-70 factor, ECF subfamily